MEAVVSLCVCVCVCSAEGMHTKHRPGNLSHAVSSEQTDADPARVVRGKLSDGDDRQYRSHTQCLREHTQHSPLRRQVAFCCDPPLPRLKCTTQYVVS